MVELKSLLPIMAVLFQTHSGAIHLLGVGMGRGSFTMDQKKVVLYNHSHDLGVECGNYRGVSWMMVSYGAVTNPYHLMNI